MRFKDANDCLKAGVAADVMAACVRAPEVLRPQALKSIYDFEQEIWSKFHPNGQEQVGLLLPWGNRYGSSLPFRFRYGEVTVWTGYNKHGKSEVLNHVVVDLCWQGDKALICSLEVSAPETYRKLIRMVMGRRDVCAPEERDQFRERCLKPLADKVWVYDHVGNAQMDDVFNVMLYAFQRYGCRQFVLDSLMKFDGLDGEGQDQWNKQRDFMNRLTAFAGTYGVHLHLVAHSKKPDRMGDARIPRRYDISGSAYISNQPHNVIVIWRNRAKQDKLEELFQSLEDRFLAQHEQGLKDGTVRMPEFKRLMGGPPHKNASPQVWQYWRAMLDFVEKELDSNTLTELTELLAKHDSYFIVDAQRGGDGDCPVRYLWFHFDSLQFIEASPWNGKIPLEDPRKRPFEYASKLPAQMDEEL